MTTVNKLSTLEKINAQIKKPKPKTKKLGKNDWFSEILRSVRIHLKISLVILKQFLRINLLLFHLKSSDNHRLIGKNGCHY